MKISHSTCKVRTRESISSHSVCNGVKYHERGSICYEREKKFSMSRAMTAWLTTMTNNELQLSSEFFRV